MGRITVFTAFRGSLVPGGPVPGVGGESPVHSFRYAQFVPENKPNSVARCVRSERACKQPTPGSETFVLVPKCGRFRRSKSVFPSCSPSLAFCFLCRHGQVDKYDDPNTAVNKLMLALTGMGFDLNFPANRLKQVNLRLWKEERTPAGSAGPTCC